MRFRFAVLQTIAQSNLSCAQQQRLLVLLLLMLCSFITMREVKVQHDFAADQSHIAVCVCVHKRQSAKGVPAQSE